jgi:hypothetical protein
VILIDAANVVGSRPNGWWRDRPGAARLFVNQVRAATTAGRLPEPVVVVLEGLARNGVDAGVIDGVEVVLAPGGGDDTLVALARDAVALAGGADATVTLVSADRELRRRAESAGANVASPGWLLQRLPA